MNILIITYYWPPAGGSGVQRWLYMANHLADIPGNNVTVFVPDTQDYQILDPTLSADVSPKLTIIKGPIWDPAHFYNKAAGEKNKIGLGMSTTSNQKSFIQKLGLWLRANVFIPDSRIFWVKPSYKFLKKHIEQNNIDVIVTTGPPHSIHLIGLKLKQYFKEKIIWVADFRDPWSEIDYINVLKPSIFALNKIKKYESTVLRNADIITTIGNDLGNKFKKINNKINIQIIENGYEKKFFKKDILNTAPSKFNILHLGVLSPTRNPRNLWKAIGEIKEQNKQFSNLSKIELIGNIDGSIITEINKNNLQDITHILPPVSHQESINYENDAAILLLIINNTSSAKSIITGKIFEYFAAGRPILGIGPTDGDAAMILGNSEYAKMIDWDDLEGIKDFILNIYKKYIDGDRLIIDYPQKEIYSRENLAKKFYNILENYKKSQ
ncbi:MAG TPA: hypothetical protein PK371_03365 [Bacteroidales bacterium]|nr:hypothetical protein [Bacteroidales bacterium]